VLEKSVVSPILAGRAEQVAAFNQRLGLARTGQGQVVLISAEAGVGKTRLVEAIKAQANGLGFTILQGNCLEADRSLPHGPLADLLRGFLARRAPEEAVRELGPAPSELVGILPELAEYLPAPPYAAQLGDDKYRLYHALERFLFTRAAQAPLLLVVEDAHWSDDASLDFLLHLARRVAAQPMLLVLTFRGDEAGPALARFLQSLNRARLADEVPLAPLTQDEVDVMLRAIFEQTRPVSAEFLQAICQLTEGNPFFIEEVLKSLLAAGDIYYRDGVWDRKPISQLRIPHTIQVAVQQRLAQLHPAAKQLTLLAAVTGRRFQFDLLQRLTGMDEPLLLSHLKQLVAAQLIVEETAEAFAFRHALTREAVYATLLRRERQVHHRSIAEILERQYHDQLDQHAADLAHHYFQAGEWQKVVTYAQRAGDRARAMFAPREATALYGHALEAAEHLGQTPSAELLRARGQAFETLGEIERARADYSQALLLAQHSQDRRAEWQSLVDLGFLWAAQDYARAGDYFRQALALAQELGDPALLAHSLNRVGNWHTNLDQPQTAQQYLAEALAHFEKLGDAHGRAETLDLLGMTTSMGGDFVAGVGYYRQAVELFAALDDRRGLAAGLSVLGEAGATYMLDAVTVAPISLPEAHSYAVRGLEICRQIGWRSGESYALSVVSLCSGSLGHGTRALEEVQSALEVATEIEHSQWMAFAQVAYGLALGSMLALPQARERFEQAAELAQAINSPFWIGFVSHCLAEILIQQNELERAETLLGGSGEPQTPLTNMAGKMAVVARLELALARGNLAAAEAEVGRLLAAVKPFRLNVEHLEQAAPRLLKLHGEFLTAQKRFPEALATLEAALNAAKSQGARPLEWRVHLSLGECWRAQRRFDAAEAAFAAARGLIEILADEIPAGDLRENFLRAALAQLPGSRPASGRRAAKREFGGLTERERGVAALVGQGLSNRQIAAALVLSDRTVEKHVSNILGKLGVETRAQVIAWVLQKGLLSDTPG
jgi:DNA-binding CsgD family transcriptional regulator/tetratricopeptide (TPR) repeat protein